MPQPKVILVSSGEHEILNIFPFRTVIDSLNLTFPSLATSIYAVVISWGFTVGRSVLCSYTLFGPTTVI